MQRVSDASDQTGQSHLGIHFSSQSGGGTTVDNNQRLKVAALSHEWKDDPAKGGKEPYLDAAIVGWNRKFGLRMFSCVNQIASRLSHSPLLLLVSPRQENCRRAHDFSP